MKDYLNSQKVMQFGATSEFPSSIKVIVYRVSEYLPARDCTPNPRNPSKVEGVEFTYSGGFFTEKVYRYLTSEQFNDPTFWNS